MTVLFSAAATFLILVIGLPVLLGLCRLFGLYTVVQERSCCVYVLFGKVIGVLDEPGLYFLPTKLGLAAFFVNFLVS